MKIIKVQGSSPQQGHLRQNVEVWTKWTPLSQNHKAVLVGGFFQPIWEICASQIGSFPQVGVKMCFPLLHWHCERHAANATTTTLSFTTTGVAPWHLPSLPLQHPNASALRKSWRKRPTKGSPRAIGLPLSAHPPEISSLSAKSATETRFFMSIVWRTSSKMATGIWCFHGYHDYVPHHLSHEKKTGPTFHWILGG